MAETTYRVWLVPCDEEGKRKEDSTERWPVWMSNFMDIPLGREPPVKGTLLHIACNTEVSGQNDGEVYFRVIDQYRFVDQTIHEGKRTSNLTDRVELYVSPVNSPWK